MSTPALNGLRELPLSERRGALEELVVADFKSVLYMTEGDDFPPRESFFDLGLTSLRLTEIKERLEALLGRAISANSLFNSPTLESLLRHLTEEVLPDLFPAGPPDPGPRPAATDTSGSPGVSGGPSGAGDASAGPDRDEIDDLLRDLYRA